MEREERNSLVQNLEFVAGLLKRFEQQYNLVVSLPRTKSMVYSDRGRKTVTGVTRGASFVGLFVLGLFIMILPSLIIESIFYALIVMVTGETYEIGGGAIIIWIVLWLAMSIVFANLISKNAGKMAEKKLNDHNKNAAVHNESVDKQIAVAEENCNVIRNEIAGYDLSWYPPDYFYSDAAESFARYLRNQRANSLGEAVNLYEEEKYRNEMTDLQRQQLTAAWTQCILQAQTINAIYTEGQMTRDAINTQGQMTRDVINTQGQMTRNSINSAANSVNQGISSLRSEFNRRFGN